MDRVLSTVLLGFAASLGALFLSFTSTPVVQAAVDDTPDCDTVAIIRCGVSSPQDMREKAAEKDVPKVFNAFGISQRDLRGTFENGIVWKDGRVTVDGKVVATGAMTAGRNYGGTPIDGTRGAGKYSTSKFVTEGQTAYVKMINGKFSFAVIKSCGNPVSATPKTPEKPKPTPTYECVSLKSERISRTKYRFVADGNVSGGLKIAKYEFTFGDGVTNTTTNRSISHIYERPGTYTATVTLLIKSGDVTQPATSESCKVSVTVSQPPKKPEPCPYDSSLPANSADCTKPEEPKKEMCPIEGKENLPKDSADCVEEKGEDLPQTIADTGIGGVMSGVVGSGALGYGAYSYFGSRRHLLGTFLNRHK